jgi:MFS family permease
MATVRVALVSITLAFTPVAGWILDHFGYRALLPLAALSGMGSALIFYPVLRRVPDTLASTSRAVLSPGQILRADRRMPFYLAGVLLFGLGALISAPLYPAIQVDQLNMSYTLAGVLGLVQSVFWFLGYLFGGRILDRLGGIRALQIVFIINAFVMLPYIWATQGWMLFPSFMAAGLVTAGADLAALYTVIELAGPERVPAYTALSSIVTGFRGLLGPFIGSVLVQVGWPFWAVFALSAGLTVMGAASLLLVAKAKAPTWKLSA